MKTQICLVPELSGLGGMVSFQAKLIHGLTQRGVQHTFNLADPENNAILVIGGTRHLWRLWQAKRLGIPIFQRLNGMNWLHQVEKTPIKSFLRAEGNNRLLAFIRRRLADHIIYQSHFSQDWWERVFAKKATGARVVYNGVDLDAYHPDGVEKPPQDHDRLLLVEGHLSGANARGLITAVRLAVSVAKIHSRTVELMVVGDVSDAVKAQAHTLAPDLWITWRGVVPRSDIPAIDRSAHVLFSADLNAACPNSVIEAMACGLPILAYDTGALGELVQNGAGVVVPYGSDHWQLEEPVIEPLAAVCIQILQNNPYFRQRARLRAEAAFSLDKMVDGYIEAMGIG